MVKLTIRHLNSEAFHEALTKLAKHKKFTFKTSYKLSQLLQKIIAETKTARGLYVKWADEFYEKDAGGKFIPASKEETQIYGTPWKIKEGQAEKFLEKMNEFLALEVEFEADRIAADELESVELAPVEVTLLTPIFDLEGPQS